MPDRHPFPTCSILGVNIAVTDMKKTVSWLEAELPKLSGSYICVSNVHTTVTAYEDESYRAVQNGAALALPDGKPLSLTSRKRGFAEAERVTGPDLMGEIFRISAGHGWRHYFYGSTEETLAALKEALERRYPGIRIAGMYSPPFRPLTAEEERAVDDMRRNLSVINDCRAVAGSVTNAYMHDVTEGGVENAVWETVTGAGLGAVIYTDEIPVDSVTEKLCSAFGVDPLRSLSSGSLLIVAENGEKLVSELKEKGVAASVIGKVTESGVYAENGSGERREISAVPDELLAMED